VRAKKQFVASMNITEAEYQSITLVTSELLWLLSLSTINVLCDNMNVIALAHNHVLHACTNHIKLDLFFVRPKVLQGFKVVHIPGHM